MSFVTRLSMVLAAALFTVSGAASADTSHGLEVKRLVFARGIDGHEPQDAATAFSAKEDRVYAFVEVANPGSEENIDVVFQPPTGAAFSVPLKVGSSKGFRTWAFTRRAHESGEWTVTVRTAHKTLAHQSFTVTR
jgi:hypothetical protein